MKLYKGGVHVTGRKSPNSLYSEKVVTFEDDAGAYDQRDAEGFIKLNALRLRLLGAARPSGLIARQPPPPAPPGPRPWWESAAVRRGDDPACVRARCSIRRSRRLVDLLGHMGRYRVAARPRELARACSDITTSNGQLIGNLGVDLLVVPLAKLFGLELAVKLIVMAIPPLTVAGFLWVAREVHHRLPPTALFALPFAFGHPFLFGFVNFALSMALAFLAFGLWLRLGRLGQDRAARRPVRADRRSSSSSPTPSAGASLGLLAFSAEAVRQHDRGIGWWRAGLRAAMHAAVMALPLLLMLLWRSGVSQGDDQRLVQLRRQIRCGC